MATHALATPYARDRVDDRRHSRCAIRVDDYAILAERLMHELAMHGDVALQSITAVYAVCNALRVLSYVPQIVAVARENSGAYAISITSWLFWMLSHAVTAVYGNTVLNDLLLASMMWGNAAGCLGVVVLTVAKRQRYGWIR